MALAVVMTANAQTFLDELQRPVAGQGAVTVTQSKEIDDLVNGKGAQQQVQQAQAQVPSPAPAVTAPAAPTKQNNTADGQTATEQPKKDAAHQPVTQMPDENGEQTVTEVDTRKKVMRNSYKMQGFRIQVFSGGNSRVDRQKAQSAGAAMKQNFPDQPVYVHFYSPSWKCRMGNYKTQAEAQAYLSRVKKLGYPQACIVKGTISVQY